ncbi:hypothetical protein [Nitrobacter sp. JJSN]|uniref:hypothetical protein n=1 Tax=Nitrobacter sp. JJSN TaxID=3453033 RepID=UPI003F76A0CB
MVEQTRPWVALRYTDTSKTVATGNTWQTAIDISTIARFNRFYGETPIKVFDGNNSFQRYRQVPFNERLLYRNTPSTFVYDEANKTLYLNGTVQYAGTLYIDHIKDSPEISLSTTMLQRTTGPRSAAITSGLTGSSARTICA